MSNTPRARKPSITVAQAPQIEKWDQFVEEAEADVEPWQKELPDGTILTVPCPTSEAIELLSEAQSVGDVEKMMEAVFGDDAPVVLDLTLKKPFTVRVRLVNSVMLHYGMSAARLPESVASST